VWVWVYPLARPLFAFLYKKRKPIVYEFNKQISVTQNTILYMILDVPASVHVASRE